MISYDRYQAILAESDAATRQAAEVAFVKLLEKIRAGALPRTALNAILKEFNADAIEGFREALNAIMATSLGTKAVMAYKVGKAPLSAVLYANAQAVAANTQQIIEKHMAGIHDARELRKALYEGYSFQDDPLKVIKPLPKYLQVEFDKFKAAALKTPALRAAYLEAIKKAEAGAGMDELEKTLKVAFYERNRYYANRIAQTELHRNYTDQVARELMEDDQIEYVQVELSSRHPKIDQCDRHAKLDAWGLGPGVYPKAEAPKPPFHSFCRCICTPKIDIYPAKPPRFNPKAERAFLAKLPPREARDVAGSWAKLERATKGGESLEAIYNEGKDDLYKWKRIGDFSGLPKVAIRPIPPTSLAPPTPPVSYWQTGTPEGDWHESSFNDAPIWLKQAIQREGTLPGGVKHTPGKTAYHLNGSSQYIEMGDERPNGPNPAHHQATWRHEYGHALDYKLGKKAGRMVQKDATTWKSLSTESESPEFTKAMKADSRELINPPGLPALSKTDEWKKAKLAMMEAKRNEIIALRDLPADELTKAIGDMAQIVGTNYADVKAALLKHCPLPGDVESSMIHVLSALKYRDAQGLLDTLEVGGKAASCNKGIVGFLSDLFSAATNKKIEGCGSHSASYYKQNPSKRNMECFANLTSLVGEGNPFWTIVVERMCPNMTKAFYEALR